MVEQNKNKGLFLGIAAATALVGAALLYHFVFSDGEEVDQESELLKDLQEQGLAEVKKAANGKMLDPEYFLKLLNFITTSGRKRRDAERKEALEERRECYKSKSWDRYRAIVQEQFMAEDQMMQKVMGDVTDVLDGLDQQIFQQTMGMLAQHPQYQQMMMAAQQGKLPTQDQLKKSKDAPKLTKQKTLAAFGTSKTMTMEAMKKQAQLQRQATNQEKDEMELMVDMFVDQAKIEDGLFTEEGVTNDELEEAIMFFMGKNDPEVRKAMTAYMMEMQKEANAMGGGGMPGMPGM